LAGLQRALPASCYLDPAAFGLHPVGAWTFTASGQSDRAPFPYVVERVGEPGAVAPGPIGDPEADV
jgi:hypothetical protein